MLTHIQPITSPSHLRELVGKLMAAERRGYMLDELYNFFLEPLPPREPFDRACVALEEPRKIRDNYDGSANHWKS